MDGDTDRGDNGDAEPSLAAPERQGLQVTQMPGTDQDREAEPPEIVLTKAVVEPGAECLPQTSCRGVAAGTSSRQPASRRLTS